MSTKNSIVFHSNEYPCYINFIRDISTSHKYFYRDYYLLCTVKILIIQNVYAGVILNNALTPST